MSHNNPVGDKSSGDGGACGSRHACATVIHVPHGSNHVHTAQMHTHVGSPAASRRRRLHRLAQHAATNHLRCADIHNYDESRMTVCSTTTHRCLSSHVTHQPVVPSPVHHQSSPSSRSLPSSHGPTHPVHSQSIPCVNHSPHRRHPSSSPQSTMPDPVTLVPMCHIIWQSQNIRMV